MILYPYKISAVLSAAPSSPSFNHFVFVVNKKKRRRKAVFAKADIIFGLFQIISQINVFIFKKNKGCKILKLSSVMFVSFPAITFWHHVHISVIAV